jgi:hypothetical protein
MNAVCCPAQFKGTHDAHAVSLPCTQNTHFFRNTSQRAKVETRSWKCRGQGAAHDTALRRAASRRRETLEKRYVWRVRVAWEEASRLWREQEL